MLNIPDSVKALYLLDSCRKNFRVRFPNGELPDVTNDNVVQESVQFTESLCSQDTFRFGLTEASVIKFETVGVANMYGMMIRCSSEIDCSSLTAEEIEEIEDGEWDGEYVPLADSDLGYPYFRVPYGVFRVESCQRDHQAMTHRKVEAMTKTGGENMRNDFEDWKCSRYSESRYYKPRIKTIVVTTILQKDPDSLVEFGYTKHTITDGTPGSRPGYLSREFQLVWSENGPNPTAQDLRVKDMRYFIDRVSEDVRYVTSQQREAESPDVIFAVKSNKQFYSNRKKSILDAVKNYLENVVGEDPVECGFSGWKEMLEDCWQRTFVRLYSGWGTKVHILQSNYMIEDGSLFNLHRGVHNETYLQIPTRIQIKNNGTFEDFVVLRTEAIDVYWDESSDLLDTMTISPDPTLTQNNSANKYSFANAFSVQDLVQGYFEITARFVTADRFGSNKPVRLSNASPVAVTPGDYSQMWWDEYDVKPVGTVRYLFTDDAGEEQVVDYEFGDGESIYDMTENETLSSMENASKSVIESLLDTYFIPHLSTVNFTPVDLIMKGLPFVEAGDAITVTAQDGTEVNTYVLRNEISGIQSLEAQIDSESGLIIDSEEAET